MPEWETPAVDQTALIPWGLERYYRRTGEKDLVATIWPMIEQAATVCCGNSGGHPGLRMLEDLNLISSAGSGDQLFGAFLYPNACVVAGLRASARLATQLGVNGAAEEWGACADRIWNDGIHRVVAVSHPESPGMIDSESGRFFQARRLSRLRGLWTDNPKLLTEHARTLDINMLGLAVPFGLLPASDPLLVRTAESILRANEALKGDPNVLARTSYESSQSGWSGSGGDQNEVSSVATLWMVRFLLQLGRETGQGRHWTRAIAMLDAILARLSQPRPGPAHPGRGMESARQVANPGGTGWRLHGMLIETMMDWPVSITTPSTAGSPCVRFCPGHWPQTGIKHSFACGNVSYRLERPIGGRVCHLNLTADLRHPVTLEVALTCPDLKELGPWQASPAMSAAASSTRGPDSSSGASPCLPAPPPWTGPGE